MKKQNVFDQQRTKRRNSSSKRWVGLASVGLAGDQFTCTITLADVLQHTQVSNRAMLEAHGPEYSEKDITQRPLAKAHAHKLAAYIMAALTQQVLEKADQEGLKKVSRYAKQVASLLPHHNYYSIPPVVLTGKRDLFDGIEETVPGSEGYLSACTFPSNYKFDTADGNHRRVALGYVDSFINKIVDGNKIPSGNEFETAPLASKIIKEISNKCPVEDSTHYKKMDAHNFWFFMNECLNELEVVAQIFPIQGEKEREQQTFAVINGYSLHASRSQRDMWDHSNPVNRYIESCRKDARRFKCEVTGSWIKVPMPELVENDVVQWPQGGKTMTRSQAMGICSFVVSGKMSSKTLTDSQFEPNSELLDRFWIFVQSLPYIRQDGAMKKTLAAQPVMQQALGKLVHELAYSVEGDMDLAIEKMEEIKKRAKELFAQDKSNSRFLPYKEDGSIRDKKYRTHLPPHKEGVNRNTGGRDASGLVRFGAKTNDIRPRLVDILRFELNLNPNKNRGPSS